jgi:hypothetical protein
VASDLIKGTVPKGGETRNKTDPVGVSLGCGVTDSTPSQHAASAVPAPENGPWHLSRMGRTGWWDVTSSAYQPEREESMVHIAHPGYSKSAGLGGCFVSFFVNNPG